MPPPKNKQNPTTYKKKQKQHTHSKQKQNSSQMKQTKMPRLEWNNYIFSVLKVMHVQRQL